MPPGVIRIAAGWNAGATRQRRGWPDLLGICNRRLPSSGLTGLCLSMASTWCRLLTVRASLLGSGSWPNCPALRTKKPPTECRRKRLGRRAQSEGRYHLSGAASFVSALAGRYGVAVGVPVASSDRGPSLWSVHVAVTSTVYSVPLVRFGIVWVVEPEVIVAMRALVL